MAKKTVQIVLNKDIHKLGKTGDLKHVALGYARNYLLPSQVASLATPTILKSIEQQALIKKQVEQQLVKQLEKLKIAIEGIGQITLNKKLNNSNKIFGSVTDREIVEIINSNLGQTIDRKSIIIPEISEIGNYEIQINLGYKINTKLNLQVIPV